MSIREASCWLSRDGDRIPKREHLWRYGLCARIVAYSVVLGAIDGASQEACDRAFWHWFERTKEDLESFVAGLEREMTERGKGDLVAMLGSMIENRAREYRAPFGPSTDPRLPREAP